MTCFLEFWAWVRRGRGKLAEFWAHGGAEARVASQKHRTLAALTVIWGGAVSIQGCLWSHCATSKPGALALRPPAQQPRSAFIRFLHSPVIPPKAQKWGTLLPADLSGPLHCPNVPPVLGTERNLKEKSRESQGFPDKASVGQALSSLRRSLPPPQDGNPGPPPSETPPWIPQPLTVGSAFNV